MATVGTITYESQDQVAQFTLLGVPNTQFIALVQQVSEMVEQFNKTQAGGPVINIDKVRVTGMDSLDPERALSVFKSGLRLVEVPVEEPLVVTHEVPEIASLRSTPTVPYPDAVKRKDYPEGFSVALLQDGTKIKYETATGVELERKSVVSQEPVQPFTMCAEIAANANATRQTCDTMTSSGEYDRACITTNNDIRGINHDGTVAVLPSKVIGLDPTATRRMYDHLDLVSTLQTTPDLVTLLNVVSPIVNDSRDAIIKWCVEHQTEVPILANIPADRVAVKVIRALEFQA